MAYLADIFSVATFEAFSKTDKAYAGFHPKRRAWLKKVVPGDKVVCYLKGVGCWVGILEITGDLIESQEPYHGEHDVFTLRFPVKVIVWLERGFLLPIKSPLSWNALSFTKNLTPGEGGWNALLRSSAVRLPEADGKVVEQLLLSQSVNKAADGISDDAWNKQRGYKLTVGGQTVTVQIPEKETSETQSVLQAPSPEANEFVEVRTSHKMQAVLADIGARLGLQVWIPKADREAVLKQMTSEKPLLKELPTMYNEATHKTVEQIDVLWVDKKSIIRAFEVEHTTAVYSGILRMADLLALQPNFVTKLHIVAPDERRKKVYQELQRPAFSIFPQGPLAKLCTYLPYEKVAELSNQTYLEYMTHDVVSEFEELAESAD